MIASLNQILEEKLAKEASQAIQEQQLSTIQEESERIGEFHSPREESKISDEKFQTPYLCKEKHEEVS